MRGVRGACTFCCETLRARNHIVYEDARVIAMLDHNPRAKKHVLVIPHEHIRSVDDLTSVHCDLLEHMLVTGKEILAKDGFVDTEDCRFGFHRPPFASVPHLHMHCLGLPFAPAWNRLRYTESMLPSYISADSALAALRTKRDTLDTTSSSVRGSDE
ncbi:hypothetical protein PF005_g4197 [Phytophthora fragariae]|uniref:HIT domain-containing protein n=1 Tax=Phytophthora fragariae TaxID=53985 RepID=A0A6A3Z5A5_9STRA|nr:hypothetical protein PF003_g23461 [Phytophthora fragariae]KAE8945736.1 hypothetical protein PF009_g4619 [Phytophthora fragariae]KAE9023468.1 hypothetical protein PF011_g3984 [Phytophthora fragariae]KAE9129532.1 hypothetical protein PF010_g4169 [Phytophthora fragariae]KAE9133701.1 hypothetical protein PF007_g3254 [Phytophthora fragariae]